MARTPKDSLSYFPLDIGFIMDRRIQRLRARFGADGALYFLYILSAAYGGKGYYVEYTQDFIEDAADDLNCTAEKIGLMTDYLLNKSLLSRTLFDKVKALSSHGIAKQYQAAAKSLRRDVEVDERYWVLEKEETDTFIKVRSYENKSRIYEDKYGNNGDKSRKNSIKEIKLNETILNEIIGEEIPTESKYPPEDDTAANTPSALPAQDYTQACIDLIKQGQPDAANRRYYVAQAMHYQCDVERVHKETGVMLKADFGNPYY